MSNQPYTPSGFPLPQPTPNTQGVAPSFHAPSVTPMHVSPQTMPLPQPQQIQQPPAIAPMPQLQQNSATATTPVVGGDEDDAQLDEVWVAKAKEVSEKTHGDPYLKSKELSKVKAGYLKSRYNKDIKIIEDQNK